MNYGFVKVAAAVPRVKVADCKFNSERLEGLITIAEGKGVQILTFPEMCITGYTCGDLFAQQLLLEQAEMALIQILNSTRQLVNTRPGGIEATTLYTSSPKDVLSITYITLQYNTYQSETGCL